MTQPAAKSDGANALDLKQLKPLLETLLAIHKSLQDVIPKISRTVDECPFSL